MTGVQTCALPIYERLGLAELAQDAQRDGDVLRLVAAGHVVGLAGLACVEAELNLQQAAEIARAAPSCLLCYEADWQVCHRRRISEPDQGVAEIAESLEWRRTSISTRRHNSAILRISSRCLATSLPNYFVSLS